MRATIFASILSALVAAFAVSLLRDDAAPNAAEASTADAGRLGRIEESLAQLERRLADRPVAAPAPTTRIAPADLQAEVARAVDEALARLRATGGLADLPAAANGDAALSGAAPTLPDLDLSIAAILDPQTSRAKTAELWKALVDAGMLQDALDLLQEKIEADPTNADLHAELGMGLIQKLLGTENDMEKGLIAMQADAVFDEALTLDEQHWDARFSKAVSLSFWPPITGKGPEAIKNFETLMTQQEARGDRRPEYAETYLYLGNMYQQRGDSQKASEIWTRGAALFPDHSGLKGQLGQ